MSVRRFETPATGSGPSSKALGTTPGCFANPPDIGLDMVGFRCAGDAARNITP